MKKCLKNISIDDLRLSCGASIRSLKIGREGKLDKVSDAPDREDYTIDILWDNGEKSINVWHFWTEHLEFID